MTDPLGQYWDQPDRSLILIDDRDAVMERSTFEKLHEYSCTVPSAVYPGKMWRCSDVYQENLGKWWLRFYTADETDPGFCRLQTRNILLLDDEKEAL